MKNSSYVITTDNTIDMPPDFIARHNLSCVRVNYAINDVMYDGEIPDLSPKDFYQLIREKAMPVTQQGNPDASRKLFEPYLKQGLDILHIAFSSGLSGTYQSNCIAANELRELYPDRKIIVIDSLCASMGEGLLVSMALRMWQQGKDIDQVAAWVTDNRLRLVHDVIADDLFHLQRGGRVSKASAIVGTALGIKPLIYLNDEGKLIPFGKTRGKKNGLAAMADRLARKIDKDSGCDMIYICHSDVLEDAQELERMVRDRHVGIDNFLINYIGPTIGSHTGVGTVAIFYFAKDRSPS